MRLVIAALLIFASGCAFEPPKPFPEGAATDPPFGCTLLRQRNGEC